MLQFYNSKRLSLAIALLLFSLSAFSQAVIKGTIKDEAGNPLPGVTIKVKEAPNVGVTTDNNGLFSLKSAPSYQTLVISLLSYVTQEVAINGRETINIVLREGNTSLNEVIVTGYTTVERRDLTGSVGTVKVDELQKANARSFEEALAGRVPGVQVTSNDGKPGSGVTILIRGIGSLTQSSAPLYVVDGFPIDDPNNNIIDPNTIETFTVLKDAAATAIYGARGSNGVIVITTKRGQVGTPKITYSGSYGINDVQKYIQVYNPFEYAQLQNTSFFNSGTSQALKDAASPWFADGRILEDYRNASGVDWQDLVLRVAPQHMHSLSISGGTDKTRFSLTGNGSFQDGIVIASDYSRYQVRTTFDQTVNKQLKVGLTASYNNLKQTGAPTTSAASTVNSPLFWNAYGLRPVEIAGLETNFEDQLYDPNLPAADLRINPIISIANTVNNNIQNHIAGTVYGEYALTKSLKFKSEAGLNYRNIRTELFNGSKTQSGGPNSTNQVNGALGINQITQSLIRNSLNFNKNFNNAHRVNVFGAFEVQTIKSKNSRIAGTLLPNEALGLSGIDAGTITPFPSTFTANSSSSLVSGLVQATYNYKSRYYLTGSFRADASSRFRGENRWAYFPSGGVKWKISEEKFMKGLKVVSDANIRATYGTTGNNNVADYASYSTINFQNPLLQNNILLANSAVVTSLDNPTLKWEEASQFDAGIDVSFFKNRLTVTADYYNKIISDLLFNAKMPGSSGYNSTQKNIGKIGNRGFEFSIEGDIIQKKNFSWNANFNISFNRNRLLALSAPDETAFTSTINWESNYNAVEAFIARIGGPLGEIYGYISDGLYQLSDFERSASGGYTLKAGIPVVGTTVTQPGDAKFRDLDHNGIINANDRAVIGRGYPIHTGGFSNNFRFKGFDLNVFLQWSYGAEVLNANRLWFEDGMGLLFRPGYNQLYTETGRWSLDNQDATQPRIGAGFTGYTSEYVEDASFIRLKNVNIGYNFPQALLKKVKISNLRVFLAGTNVYTLTKYKGYDPEVSTYATGLTPGMDWSSYPRAMTISGGINLTF